MKRAVSLILAVLLMLAGMSSAPAEQENYHLSQGLSMKDALTVAVACAVLSDYELDTSSARVDSASQQMSIKAGVFTFSVSGSNGLAESVSISSAYLDSNYAKDMGVIFGRMVSAFTDIQDVNLVLGAIDFNAFDSMKDSTQSLVYGDCRITARVDPEADECYQLSISLLKTNTSKPVRSENEAMRILEAMGADVSASFSYTAETDLNKLLGKDGEYYAKVNFSLISLDPDAVSDPKLSVEQGGSIEVFDTPQQAIARMQKTMLNGLNYLGIVEYDLVSGSALLRLSGSIQPEEAGTLFASFMRVTAAGGNSQAAAAKKPAAKPTATPKPAYRMPAVGSTVYFGTYEQDNSTANGKEDIEWLVLKVDGTRAMLLSVYALDVYNRYWASPTWDNSTLRAWLNGDFLKSAFSPAEQKALIEADVPAEANPNYTSNPGQNTKDHVFCLSYPEADSLLTRSQRRTMATTYARRRAKVYTDGSGCCYWWLRSPGRPGCGAAIVAVDGTYDYDAEYDGFSYGVRPAVWVDLTAGLLH